MVTMCHICVCRYSGGWGVNSRYEGSLVGTGSNQVSFGRLYFGWGVDAGNRCRMVPTILICLDESCVMRIAMLMF